MDVEIIEKISRFFDKKDLPDEECYFMCRFLQESYWNKIKGEGLGDDDIDDDFDDDDDEYDDYDVSAADEGEEEPEEKEESIKEVKIEKPTGKKPLLIKKLIPTQKKMNLSADNEKIDDGDF